MIRIWQQWKKVTSTISDFQANLIFSLLYFILFSPIGIFSSFLRDFLLRKRTPHWKKMDYKLDRLENMLDQ